MKDKFEDYFSETNFDLKTPQAGHFERFQNKLNNKSTKKSFSWKWMSVAASIVLVLGFWMGSSHQQKQYDLANVSPKMKEVQNYFVSTITQELKEIEGNRSLATETIIEQALDELEDLEDNYSKFLKELEVKPNKQIIIAAMINNYQQRLLILENVMQQIKLIKNPKKIEDAIII